MIKPKQDFRSTFLDNMIWSYYIFSFGQRHIHYVNPWLWPFVGLGIVLTCIIGAPIAFIVAGITTGITTFLNWLRRDDYCLNHVFTLENESLRSHLFEKANKAIVLFDNHLYSLNEESHGQQKLYKANGNDLAYDELVLACTSASRAGYSGKLADAYQRQLIASVISLQYSPTPRIPTEPVVEIAPLLHEKIILEKSEKINSKIDELTEFLRTTEANKPDAQALFQVKSALKLRQQALVGEITSLDTRIRDVGSRMKRQDLQEIDQHLVEESTALCQEQDTLRQEGHAIHQQQNTLSQEISRSAYFERYPFLETRAKLAQAKNHEISSRSIFKRMEWDFNNEPLFMNDIPKPAPFPVSDYSQCFVTYKMLQQLDRQNTFFKKLPAAIIEMIGGMSFSEEVTAKERKELSAVSHL